MPPRRRPHAKRLGSVTAPGRKNSDSKRGLASSLLLGTDMGGVLRFVLLGALVGAVLAFLFYPDISRIVERWQNSSEESGFQRRQNEAGESHEQGDARAQPVKTEPSKVNPRHYAENGDSPKKARPSTKQTENGQDKAAPRNECDCKTVTTEPECRPPGNARERRTTTKEERPPKGDLMEEEELEVEEEDPVEVELMEEEEPIVYIDLKDEDETPSEPARTADDATDVEQKAAEDHVEQSILKDEQTITFTPVSPGDESVIRLGGRPKPGSKTSTSDRESSGKAKKVTQSTPSEKNSSTKTATPNKVPKRAKAEKPATAKSSHTKEESRKKEKRSPTKSPTAAAEDGPDDADLPEEVRNFQPTYLRTVSAKKIFADGRRIPPVELIPQKETNSSVRVFLFNEFLSDAECDGLRRVHDKHVQSMASHPLLCFDSLRTLRKHLEDVSHDIDVSPNDFVKGTKCLNSTFSRQLGLWMSGNWSYSTAFYPGESRFSHVLSARVQQAMELDPKNGGKFQITSYPTGKAYKAHTDCVPDGTDLRDRVATVLVYLDDVHDGGETKFPELGIWVKPRKGRALVWNNMSPEGLCEPHSLHVASKVNSGSKYILIRWYYYKSFYSLGKRPPEPPLPDRPAGTPRVSCDDYDNGSCRWYDEWNNDHLLDYEYKKYTLI